MPQLDKNKRFSIQSCPQSAMITLALGLPLWLPYDSIVSTSSIPSTTFPNTTCFPSSLPGHTSGQWPTTYKSQTTQRWDQGRCHYCITNVFWWPLPRIQMVTWRMWLGKVSLGHNWSGLKNLQVLFKGSYHCVLTVQMKNWDPLVFGPAFAMDRIPCPVCFKMKFSSSNLLP